ncbi:MAG: hypothetical protein ACLPJH_00165 [Myxococcaceae bacterium]
MNACVSFGQNQEETRFYFADAAVQTLLSKAREKLDLHGAAVGGRLRTVNYALRFVVEAQLRQLARMQKMSPPA